MRTASYYDVLTGVFHRQHFCTSSIENFATVAELNAPSGHRWIEGRFDYLSQRFDIASGQVVDYQPSQPSEDHEWDSDLRRWRKRADVVERERIRAETIDQIDQLQLKQLRAVTELLANADNAEARKHFDERRAQIESLRAQLATNQRHNSGLG